jgi:hypothetical protein
VIAKMKKSNSILIALLLVSFVIIGGCAKENTDAPNNTTNTTGNTNNPGDDAIFCTEDAKICSDGSAVGRDPSNNCEFPACPDEKNYIGKSTDECARIRFMCTEGKQPFFDDKGCGCEPVPKEESKTVTMCGQERPQICTREYNPVCAQVQVECIRAPFPPINETFATGCTACANPRVISYTLGACEDN